MSIERTVSARPPDAAKLEKELQRLEELAKLDSGWDGENARPLSSPADAHAAHTAYSVLATYGHAPSFIAPIPDGGVQVEWESRDSALELTIGPDGYKEILLVLNQRAEAPEVQECSESLESSDCFKQALIRYGASQEPLTT